MAFRARKTEHAGSKKGRGAYWGRKRVAKMLAKVTRRNEEKAIVRDERRYYEEENDKS